MTRKEGDCSNSFGVFLEKVLQTPRRQISAFAVCYIPVGLFVGKQVPLAQQISVMRSFKFKNGYKTKE